MAHLVKTLDLKAKTVSSVLSTQQWEERTVSRKLFSECQTLAERSGVAFFYYYFSCLHAVVCTSVALAISSGFDAQVFSVRGL